MNSPILGTTLHVQVWSPENQEYGQTYPALYFFPDFGGSPATVLEQYGMAETADRLVRDARIRPMILVAVSLDRSFGINSSETTQEVQLGNGRIVDEGRYEDAFLQDILPQIEDRFPVSEERFIGGYSAGGFAALHIAFGNPDLFQRAGGHSPTLFPGNLPDADLTAWLYPDETIRDARDPLRLVLSADLGVMEVFLDTGEADVNYAGVALLAERLMEQGVSCTVRFYPGVHSRTYAYTWMDEYLLFYGQ